MNAAMSIEDFSAFLSSEQEDSDLHAVLSKLTTIDKIEEIVVSNNRPGSMATWCGWA